MMVLKEVFLFTIDGNDILLNCFNPLENKEYIKNKLIDEFYPRNNENNSGFTFAN